jgi:hypothetical protein
MEVQRTWSRTAHRRCGWQKTCGPIPPTTRHSFSLDGVRLSPLGMSTTIWPIVPTPDDKRWWSSWWNENWQGKPKYSEKTCPSATLSTTNPTWPNLGHCGGKPATNRLSYDTTQLLTLVSGKVLHPNEDLIYQIFKIHSGFLRNLHTKL